MKTVLVVYSNNKSLNKNQIDEMKHYAFNTENEVEVGDVIVLEAYDVVMHVVKILEDLFKYYNITTGELTKNFNSTSLREIKPLLLEKI